MASLTHFNHGLLSASTFIYCSDFKGNVQETCL